MNAVNLTLAALAFTAAFVHLSRDNVKAMDICLANHSHDTCATYLK